MQLQIEAPHDQGMEDKTDHQGHRGALDHRKRGQLGATGDRDNHPGDWRHGAPHVGGLLHRQDHGGGIDPHAGSDLRDQLDKGEEGRIAGAHNDGRRKGDQRKDDRHGKCGQTYMFGADNKDIDHPQHLDAVGEDPRRHQQPHHVAER